MDSLEEYIRKNKDNLDCEAVPEQLEFERMVPAEKPKHIYRLSWIAAAACVGLVAMLTVLWTHKQDVTDVEQDQVLVLAEEWQQAADGYGFLIEAKKLQLAQLPLKGVEPTYFQVFLDELKRLDEAEKECKNQLIAQGYPPDLLRHYIELLRKKLQVVERLEKEIRKVNERSKRHPNEIRETYLAV